jgi:hypothetical protein
MIPRYQTVLFSTLLIASLVMGAVLWQLRDRAHKRMMADQDAAPTAAPAVAPNEQATLYVASDADNSLVMQSYSLPLPAGDNARARAVLGRLFELYAAPNAPHPVPGGAAAVNEVFFLPAPAVAAAPTAMPTANGSDLLAGASNLLHPNAARTAAPVQAAPPVQDQTGPEIAIVNLTGAFANAHPSGLETETLTVLSICATLHANLPRVTEVRFLVDGEQRATLAGHADLTRTYLAAQTTPTEGMHP